MKISIDIKILQQSIRVENCNTSKVLCFKASTDQQKNYLKLKIYCDIEGKKDHENRHVSVKNANCIAQISKGIQTGKFDTKNVNFSLWNKLNI